jgi:hypothetical protein
MNNNFNNGCSCRNNDCNNECENNCIAEILQVINVLQSNACPENCLNSCDRPALGGGTNCVVCNTRPIMLYTCCGNGRPWSMPTSRTNTNCAEQAEAGCSNVFRVEKVDGCCCTFRVLAPNTDTTSPYPYVATDSIFTMNINCLCSIRCLNDTFVECICG